MLSCSRPLKGWLAGCATATVVIYVVGLAMVLAVPERPPIPSVGGVIFSLLFPIPLILVITCALTIVPATLIIWLSEKFRMQSALLFGCAGVSIGVLAQTVLFQSLSVFTWLFVAAGLLAGLDYWYVAGRHAGDDRSLPGEVA
jgi:hypothetical protein